MSETTIVCALSVVKSIGWARSAPEQDSGLLESLVTIHSIWERTCYLHGGIRKEFKNRRPVIRDDCAEELPN